MSEYTPTTEGIREAISNRLGLCITGPEFERWLAQHDAATERAIRDHIAAQLAAQAAQARSTSAAFAFQQAARIANGDDQ